MGSRLSGIALFLLFTLFGSFVPHSWADKGAGNSIVYGDMDPQDIRQGNFTFDDIPGLIVNVIDFMLIFAGAISVAALIYHAVKMQLASGITGDSSGVDHAKHGMKGAMIGFVVSMSAWFLMTKFVELLVVNTSR